MILKKFISKKNHTLRIRNNLLNYIKDEKVRKRLNQLLY